MKDQAISILLADFDIDAEIKFCMDNLENLSEEEKDYTYQNLDDDAVLMDDEIRELLHHSWPLEIYPPIVFKKVYEEAYYRLFPDELRFYR